MKNIFRQNFLHRRKQRYQQAHRRDGDGGVLARFRPMDGGGAAEHGPIRGRRLSRQRPHLHRRRLLLERQEMHQSYPGT